MRGKKGQFFLLAAVIISAVIISLGAGMNKASVNEESLDFYDYSEEVQREVAAFLDYMVFNDIGDDELVDFLDSLADAMEETNPTIDVAFVYGDSKTKVDVRNYGSRDVYVHDKIADRRGETETTTTLGPVTTTSIEKNDVEDYLINLRGADSFLVKVDADSEGVLFPAFDKHMRVITIIQKEERGDVYVSIGQI